MRDHIQHLEPEQIRSLLHAAQEPAASEEVAIANAHLAHCDLCRNALRSEMPAVAARVVQLLTPPADFACLEEGMIVRYVHGEVDAFEVEMVQMHLEDCAFCTADVAELRAFRQKLEAAPQLLSKPADSPAPELVTPSGAIVPVIADMPSALPSDSQALPSRVPWWQRLREQLVPVFTKPLFPLLAGAALATCVIYVALVMPMRAQLKGDRKTQSTQLEAQISTQKTTIGEQKTEIAALEQKAETAKQAQIELAQLHKELVKMKHELVALQEQRKQDLLVKEASTPDKRPGGPSASGSEVHHVRLEPFPPAFAKYLNQRQLAYSEGAGRLDKVATDHGQTLGSQQVQSPSVEPLAPVACIVSSQFPQFRWRPVAGASHYRVEIQAPSNGKELDQNPLTSRTGVQLTYPLERDVVYGWQVLAFDKKGKEIARSPLRSFEVVDAQAEENLKRFAGSPLALSVVYARAGMPNEAERELRRYLRRNPRSIQVQWLQKQIEALRQKADEIAKWPLK